MLAHAVYPPSDLGGLEGDAHAAVDLAGIVGRQCCQAAMAPSQAAKVTA